MNITKLINKNWLALLLCLPFLTSCLEDMPAFEDANITKVGFYHRFYGPDKDVITGENILVAKELSCKYTINKEAATVEVEVTVPNASGSFTEAERNKVSQSLLWGYFNVSTAAKVSPMQESPKMGTPGNWTKANKYQVMAADGTTKIWTVTITKFTK